MALIQCKLGPLDTVVGSDTYSFRLDEHGRAVAEVANINHQVCFLSVEHYLVAPETVAPKAPVETPTPTPETAPAPSSPSPETPAATTVPVSNSGRRGKRRQG